MLDQSFSQENFKKIFEIENRRGNFEKTFYSDQFHRLSGELKKQRAIIKTLKSKGGQDDDSLAELIDEKKEIEKAKKNELEIILESYSTNVNRNDFNFSMSKVLHQPSGKDIYPLAKEASSFFAMKQLQFNVHRTFGVKQANRYLISKQVQNLLKDNFPKIILRTDVANFYESVPQFRLLRIINNNQLLTPKSKRLIKSLLFSYNNLSNQQGIPERDQVGIPRGIGISAYLAELYMRDIDEKINRLDGITYYARYVDDIFVLFTPSWKLTEPDYISKVENVIQQSGLNINSAKTYCYDLQKDQSEINIEFLGYIFKLKTSEYQGTSMSKRKIDKYLERINKSIDKYFEQLEFAPKEASKLLIHRFNYLTKNTRLHKPKKGLVGIYYSNSLIEQDCGDLVFLDEELHKIVDAKLPVSRFPKLNQKLKQYSFYDGFVNRSFFNINSKKKNISDLRPIRLKESKKLTNNFERVISIWK